MPVFVFTDIEGSTRLWEQHTGEMGAVIALHDAILQGQVSASGGRITKHTGDGITAAFEDGEPVACALETQLRFARQGWGAIGELRIRIGLHAGPAEWLAGPQPGSGDYHGPPVNCTARVMSAAWGGQILLTPEVTRASRLPDGATLEDLGQHLLKNVSAPQQIFQLDHPDLPRHEFPPPRTLSGQSIRRVVDEGGVQLVGLEAQAMGLALLSATLVPVLQGELDPESSALAGNLGVLEDLGATSLSGFVAGFAARLRSGEPLPASELQVVLQRELTARWQAADETALAIRADASRLLQAVHGVEAAMTAATGELKEALARGLADLGERFGEFGWMLGGVQDTLAEVRTRQALQLALQREQLDLQRQQLVKTNLLLHRQPGAPVAVEAPAEGPPAEVPPAQVPCPYMGLAAFEADDAEFFFGRGELVAELAARLAGTRFLAVVGPSGSGKSSLVRAGLLPAVWGGALPGSDEWRTIVLTPGSHPLEEVAVRVALLNGYTAGALMREMEEDHRSLHLSIQQALADESQDVKLLLVVDQFEEIFALCRDEEERRRFIDALLYAVEAEEGRTVVVPTIRADFYGHCADYPQLAARMSDSLLVGPMSQEELREAVERPAALVSIGLEPGLTDLILDDVAGEPGALPLLSHALLETFQRRRGRTLTLSGYAESGGVSGAIAQTADAVCASLTAEEQANARSIFLRLTELGEEGAQDTRRRVAPAELVRRPDEAAAVERVLKKLTDARLITTSENSVEVSHEALIREWPTLQAWLEEDREGLRVHRHLTVGASEWERLERDPGELYRGARLAAAGEWAAEHAEALNPLEREFLEASKELAWRAEAEREAQRQRELEAAQKLAAAESRRAEEQTQAAARLRQRALLLAGAMVVAVVLAVVAVVAFRQATQSASAAKAEAVSRATAEAIAVRTAREAQEAYSLGLAATAQQALHARHPVDAMVFALTANGISEPPEAARLVLQDAAFAPGPRASLAVAETFAGGASVGTCVALGPDGHGALIGLDTGALILFDTETRETVRRLEGHRGNVTDVAISPDGTRALSSATSPSGVVILWDLTTGQEVLRFRGHSGHVTAVAFSPDGQVAASGGFRHSDRSQPGELILWDTGTGEEIRRCTGGHRDAVMDAVFSPNGQTLLASSGFSGAQFGMNKSDVGGDRLWGPRVEDEYDLILWDVASCEIVHRFDTGDHDNWSLAIGPEGEWALSGSLDKRIYRWDLATGESTGGLEGHQNPVMAVALSKDGRTALSGAIYGHQLILWDAETGEPLSYLNAHQYNARGSPVITLDISPDGRRGLSSSADGTLVLWDLADLRVSRRLTGHGDTVTDLAFTPDGQHLVSSSGRLDPGLSSSTDNTIRIWNLGSGVAEHVLTGHLDGVTSVSVSADGKRLLSGSIDQSVRLWDLETGEEIRQLVGHGSHVTGVGIGPGGRTGLSGSADGTIMVWDLEGGRFTQTLGHPDELLALALSPNGRLALSSGSGVAPIVIWDLNSGYEAGRFWEQMGAELTVEALAVSADSQFALSGDSGGLAILWEIASGEVLGRFGGHTEPLVDAAFGPDGLRALTCDQSGTSILWDLESGAALVRVSATDLSHTETCTLSPDGKLGAVSTGKDILLLQMDAATRDEMLDWIEANRYVRDLTCHEREQYGIKPLCDE